LSKGFRAARGLLSGETDLTDANIEAGPARGAPLLLEADVEFRVTKTFLARVKDKALGETVKLRARAKGRRSASRRAKHFVKICQEELANLMGPVDTSNLPRRGPPGHDGRLQGFGKTTTTASSAAYLESKRTARCSSRPDVYRPRRRAAQVWQQLQPAGVAEEAPPPRESASPMRHATRRAGTWLFDTAAASPSTTLMQELSEIKLRTGRPTSPCR